MFLLKGRGLFLAGAAFEDGDDGVEGEADGAESGENAGGHEILVGEPGGLEKECGEEKTREGGDNGDDGNPVSQRVIGVPDFGKQDDLARNAPANQRQAEEHESDEVDGASPKYDQQDDAENESQGAHREGQPRPFGFLLERVAAPDLPGDACHQGDKRRADAGDAEHDAAGDDVGRERAADIEQDAPNPRGEGRGADDADKGDRLADGESLRVDRKRSVGRIAGNLDEARRRGRGRRNADGYKAQAADHVARDNPAGHPGGEDEDAADERGQREGVADGGEDVFGCFVVGADQLADDGGRRAVEGHADGAEEEYDGSGRQACGVVARRVDIGPVGKTECRHRKRDGAEKYADTVVHGCRNFFGPRANPVPIKLVSLSP